MGRHLDSAELKFVVPAGQEGAAVEALGLDLRDAEVRQVFYVDTPELALLSHGVVLRARRRPAGDQDVAVKVRPELPPCRRAGRGLTVELDVVPGMSVRTATLKCERPRGTLEQAIAGVRPLRKLFSKEQRELISRIVEVDWSSVRMLGPVEVLMLTTRVPGLGPRLVVQLWRYPEGTTLLELSTRVRPRDLGKQSVRFWALVARLGFDTAQAQQTKSTRSLALLSRD